MKSVYSSSTIDAKTSLFTVDKVCFITLAEDTNSLCVRVPGVDAHGSEVQFVFGLEDERLGADLQDGWRLHRRGDGEQSGLRRNQRPVFRQPVLAVDELQAAVEVQSLETNNL